MTYFLSDVKLLYNKNVNDSLHFFACRYFDVVIRLSTTIEKLSHWCEACPCHFDLLQDGPFFRSGNRKRKRGQAVDGHVQTSIPSLYKSRGFACHMRGKKLPELVADGIGQVLTGSLAEGQISLLVSHRSSLSNDQWIIIESDFTKGKQVLELEMRLKLDFCRRMPWLLALLAHSDHSNARRELSRALAEYDNQPENQQKHHHFLTHQAFGKQFSLRKDMVSFLHGTAIQDLPALYEFGACFRFVQITERYLEASHSVVKRKVPPNSAGPMVSLTRRLFRLASDISIEPAILQEVASVFESARVLKTLPIQLALAAHPSLCGLIGQKRVNWKIVKALNRVLYRIDVQSQFQDVADAATASKQILDKEKESSAKLALTFQKFEKQKQQRIGDQIVHVPRVGSYQHLRVQALQDHLIALSQHKPDCVFRLRLPKARFGDLLTDILDDSFCHLPAFALTSDLQSTWLEKTREAEPAEAIVTFFFQVIYSRPSSRRVVPVSAAAAGRLNSDDIAVSAYKMAKAANFADGGLGLRLWLACAPQEGNACQVQILHDLTQFFSFNELCENLHIMTADNRTLYLLEDGFFSTDIEIFRASTLVTELVERKCFKSVGPQAEEFSFPELSEQDQQCLDHLIELGLVERSAGGGLMLTEASLSHVNLCRRYSVDIPVHRALQANTGMEPTLHETWCKLEDAGFTWRAVKPKEVLAYIVGEDKVWGTRGKHVHLENLQCLLKAESLRDKYGIMQIPGCQKKSVYVDLLEGKQVAAEEPSRPCLQLVDDLHVPIEDAVPPPLQLEDQQDDVSDAEDDLSVERLIQLFEEDVELAGLGVQHSSVDVEQQPEQPVACPEQGHVGVPVREPSMPSSSSAPSGRQRGPNSGQSIIANPIAAGPDTSNFVWGAFRFTYKRTGAQVALQATCPFHARSQATGCKKSMNVTPFSAERLSEVTKPLKHWCVCAKKYSRQRTHMGMPLLASQCPDAQILESQIILAADKPDVVKTDKELDDEMKTAAAP